MRRLSMTLLLTSVLATSIYGQADFQFDLPGLGGVLGGDDGRPKVTASAQFTVKTSDRPAYLFVTAEITDGWHIYSTTQKSGGPLKTEIRLDKSPHFRLAGEFRANVAPKVHVEEEIWPGLPLEELYGTVTWFAPIELAPGIGPSLEIKGLITGQACQTSCVSFDVPFTAVLGDGVAGMDMSALVQDSSVLSAQPLAHDDSRDAKELATIEGEYRAANSAVLIRGEVSPQVVQPGGTVEIELTAEPDAQWHIYALEDAVPDGAISQPTLIQMESADGLTVGRAAPDRSPIEKELDLGTLAAEKYVEKYYEEPVTWTIQVRIPDDAPPGSHVVSGVMGYQVCSTGCQLPLGVSFRANIEVGQQASAGSRPVEFAESSYAYASKLADAARTAAHGVDSDAALDPDRFTIDDGSGGGELSLGAVIFWGFVGGIILNLMPCVLPVIGLKLMSFVEQAGQSRAQAFTLNIWYSAGLISVFMVLATLAVVVDLQWGGQFGSASFNVILTAVVFAMALSLLGVWEIPIPGFVGGNDAMKLTEKEGPMGAFSKGVITTILATPCTGPYVATTLAWAVRQPSAVTYGVFFSIGLGMASPYLIIGAFPALIRFLPKPGAWMGTFKQVMGFVLLGTVVYLLTIIDSWLVVPSVAFLLGIGAGCWWISRTPITADFSQTLNAWLVAGSLAGVSALFAFGWLSPNWTKSHYDRDMQRVVDARMSQYVDTQLAHSTGSEPARTGDAASTSGNSKHWTAFTPNRLKELTRENRTVLVDFTADWCLTCKALEATVLHTEEVENIIERNNVVTLEADYTKKPPEIDAMLKSLQSNGVPVIAIFPAGNPNRPIVFRGAYTKKGLIEALEKAGPSQDFASASVATRTVR